MARFRGAGPSLANFWRRFIRWARSFFPRAGGTPGALPRFLLGSPGAGPAAGALGAVEAGAGGASPGADGVAVGFALPSLALPSFSLPSLPLAALVFSVLGVSSFALGSFDFFGSFASAFFLAGDLV